MLDHEARSAGVQRAARVRRVLMHRQENNLDARVGLPQPSQRLEPVEVWHGDVGDDNIRTQPSCGLNHCAAILNNPDELKLIGEKRLEAFGHHAVVVSQQHSRTAHGGSPRFNGARATILVPPPSALWMRSSPSTRERRCLIPASPRLGRACFRVGSKPTPLPRTSSSSSPVAARSSTSTELALEWRATLRSASCATLYRQRDKARVGSSMSSVALKLVRIPSTAPNRPHSALSASTNPRSSRIAGCSA